MVFILCITALATSHHCWRSGPRRRCVAVTLSPLLLTGFSKRYNILHSYSASKENGCVVSPRQGINLARAAGAAKSTAGDLVASTTEADIVKPTLGAVEVFHWGSCVYLADLYALHYIRK